MASALSSGRMPPLVQERPDQASARIGAYRPPIPCQCSISASASSVTAKPPGVRRSASHPSSLWFSCPTFCLMVIELSRASTVSWLVTHSLPGSRDRRRRSILRAGRARHGAGARYRGRDRKSAVEGKGVGAGGVEGGEEGAGAG